MSTLKQYRYPLRMSAADAASVEALVKDSGQSINSVLLLAVRKGLFEAREALCPAKGRLTTVEPLPDAVWRKIYGRPDELEGVSGRELSAFQSKQEPS